MATVVLTIGHPSLQQIIQYHTQTGSVLGCECHYTHYLKGDVSRSKFSDEAGDLLKSVKSFPLILEKSLEGVGVLHVEVWNTSTISLNRCHVRAVLRVEKFQVDMDDEISADSLSELVDADLETNQFEALKAQLQEGTLDDDIYDGAEDLLYDIFN